MKTPTPSIAGQASCLSTRNSGQPGGLSHAIVSAPHDHVHCPRRSENGIVLVMTLALLAVATLLVVAFAIVMRVENIASANYRYALQARQQAEAGLAEAMVKLHACMPEINSNQYYVTMPGRALVYPASLGTGLTNLYSTGTGGATNMNVDGDIAPVAYSGAITSQWVIVTNRQGWVVGRYCYWVDDEATKININEANQRTIPLSPVTALITPREIDLSAIPGVSPASLSSTYKPYPTTRSWAMSGVSPAICSNYIFNLTAYSADTKLTPWGEPCLNLNSYTNTPVADRVALVRRIADEYLDSPHWIKWFRSPSHTFSNRYGNSLQIAANIVDYITPVTDPPTHPPTSASDYSPSEFIGLKPTPYLNEIIITNTVSTTAGTGTPKTNVTTFTSIATIELWQMYPVAGISGNAVILRNLPTLNVNNTPITPANTIVTCVSVPANTFNLRTTTLRANYQVTWIEGNPPKFGMEWGSGQTDGVVTGVYIRTTPAPVARIDYALIPMRGFSPLPVPDSGTTNIVLASACNDPRLKPVSTNWVVVAPGNTGLAPTPGGLNNGVFNPAVTGGDGDTSCHQISFKGRIDSLGELGYIHTGQPWRTLRLGPQQPTADMMAGKIPDWAVLDMFTVTNEPVAGRININNQIFHVGGVSTNASAMRRDTALRALYQLAPFAAWANIQNRQVGSYKVPTPPPNWYSFQDSTRNPICYAMIGQICEVQGVATIGSTKADREAVIRGIANLITTRSDTFTVWVWGQSIWDINKNRTFEPGTDQILSDARLQAVVQRSTNNNWRIIYQRWITP